MKHYSPVKTTRIVNCPECGGSGMRGSTDGLREFPCHDCAGEGQWETDESDWSEPYGELGGEGLWL